MKNKPPRFRKGTRLPGWDYSTPGYYFVTICVREMVCVLGEVIDRRVVLSPEGEIARRTWLELPAHYRHIRVEPFVVMPNHVHGIIEICPADDRNSHSLTEVVRAYKTWSARQINKLNRTTGAAFWQRSFHDHIIRNEHGLHALEKYIQANPLRWREKNKPA